MFALAIANVMATKPCVVMLLNKLRAKEAPVPHAESGPGVHNHAGSNVCRCCINTRNFVPGRKPRRRVDGLYPPLSGRVCKSLGCLGSKRPRQNAAAATRTVPVD